MKIKEPLNWGKTLLRTGGWVWLTHPGALWAADYGKGPPEIIVVADTRVVRNLLLRYIADTYNTHDLLFAVWSVVLTAACGCLLGLLMDWCMSLSGLDLRDRKSVEH